MVTRDANKYFDTALLLLCGYFFWAWFVLPFWDSLFFSVILVIGFNPIYTALRSRIPKLAPVIVILLALLILIGPIGGTIFLVLKTVIFHASAMQDPGTQEYQLVVTIIEKLPAQLSEILRNMLFASSGKDGGGLLGHMDLQNDFKTISTYAKDIINTLYSSLIKIIIWLTVIIFGMYYLTIDGMKAKGFVANLLPVDGSYVSKVSSEFVEMTNTLIKVIFIIGIVQGGIGGAVLWLVGAPSAFMWTIVMVVFSMIPILGAGIVLLPTALIYALIGHPVIAGVVFATFIVVSLVDNWLKPKIVSGAKEIHPGIVLLSTAGGLVTFGPIGVFAGPIFAALILAIFDVHITVVNNGETKGIRENS